MYISFTTDIFTPTSDGIYLVLSFKILFVHLMDFCCQPFEMGLTGYLFVLKILKIYRWNFNW